MTTRAVRAPLATDPPAERHAVLQALGAFAGLVTGLLWFVVFAIDGPAPGPNNNTPTASVGIYFQTVLVFWIVSVLPSLLIPALHAMLLASAKEIVAPRRIRAASVGIALLTWPFLLIYVRSRWAILTAGVPLAILLALYGWMQGGFSAPEPTTRLDRTIRGAGIAITVILCVLIVGTGAWSWVAV